MGQLITTAGKLLVLDRAFKATPTKTTISQFKVGTGTTAPTLSDTDLETPVSIDGDNFKDFVTGYPTIDETNLQITTRALLLSTDANGNNLTEWGTVNSDGTPVLFSRSTFTSISKLSSIEVAFIQKDRLV